MSVAALDGTLRHIERLLVDSSTLIAYHTARETAHPLARHLLGRVEQGAHHAFYSVVSAAEILVRPIQAGPAETQYMHAFLDSFPNLTALNVDLMVAQQAATIRASTNLPLPDSLIVASAVLAGCGAVVFNDERWKRRCQPLFPRFRWVYLGDYA